jgi:nitrile hydratase
MDGVHDMGGMHGFGLVVREPNEPVFHAPWEGRVQAMMVLAYRALFGSVHGGRFAGESIEPARQLAAGYFERGLAALELGVLAARLVTRDELAERVAYFAAHAEAAPSAKARAGRPAPPVALERAGRVPEAAAARPPRFAVGDAVRSRNMHPQGHTRLPRYARGRNGAVALAHPAANLPDRVVAGLSSEPQTVYTVRFAARELWGPEAAPGEAVYLDLWEDYLEPGATPPGAAAPGEKPAPRAAFGSSAPWWTGSVLPPPEPLSKAIESVLVEWGLVESAAIDTRVGEAERQRRATPSPGARLVARAWLDPAFKARLLADMGAAAAEIGISTPERTIMLENTPAVRNVVVCTLCSCYSALAGIEPTWYKSPAYRSRVVIKPRAVLHEFGLDLAEVVDVRVWDTSAQHRYLVLPERPAGTEGYSEAQLAGLVTQEALLGLA